VRRFLLYTLLFLVSFILTALYTFPVDRFAGYILSKNGVSYRSIEGDIFHLKIKGLSAGKFEVKSLEILNGFTELDIKINGEKAGSIDIPGKKIHLTLKDFDISSVQKKKDITGRITADLTIKTGKNILIDGEGKIFISKVTGIPISNVTVNYTIKGDDDKNKVSAQITGDVVKGFFEGELYLPADIKKGYIKGRFDGDIFNGKVKREIFLNFSQLNI